ncbi:hypothetical protein K6025_04975 [Ehrlichia sp. JZT12]
MLSIVLHNFIAKLEAQIDECVRKNPRHNPNVIKFTYNFSSLMNQWSQFQVCWDEIKSNYDLKGSEFRIEYLVRSISVKLYALEEYARKSFMLIQFKDLKECVSSSAVGVLDNCVYSFCEGSLLIASDLVKELSVSLGENIGDIQKNAILKISERIDLLIKNCLKSVKHLAKKSTHAVQVSLIPSENFDDFKPIILNNILQDFSAELEITINNCIKRNSKYNPEFVKFTCNFVALLNQWVQFRSHCDESDFCYHSGKSQIQDLVQSITLHLRDAKRHAKQSYMFVSLKGCKKFVIGLDVFDESIGVSCRGKLTLINNLIRTVYVVVNKNFLDVQKDSLVKTYRKINLLIQNCLNSIETIEAQPFDQLLTSTHNFGIASLRPLKNSSELQDFVVTLDKQIDKCIKENLDCNPDIVRFTCNFSALIDHWSIFKSYWNKLSDNGKLKKSLETVCIEKLIKDTDECISCTTRMAKRSYILVVLKGKQEIVVPDVSGECLSCKNSLEKISDLIEKISIILNKDPDNIKKIDILKINEKINLIIQNCLGNIEAIEKKNELIMLHII